MEKTSICEIVRDAEQNYVHGSTKIGDHVQWSMHDTIETITAYSNSKHISGAQDALKRDKPFFNIVNATRNIWWRATDIDRKDIRFVPTSQSSTILAFVANVMLQNWMNENRFGQFLNQWGLTLATYGSCVSKWVERDGRLIPAVIPWNRLIVDPVDFTALPRIEKLYKTPSQLRNMATEGHPDYAGYDLGVVNELIENQTTRKNIDGTEKDNQSQFIELYEVHGVMPLALLADDIQSAPEDQWTNYRQQMHVVAYVAAEGKGEYNDYCLFKGKERQDPYKIAHLIEEDGRTLSIGAVESLFDAQWMQNHSVKLEKDYLDLASKIILQTADETFLGRNAHKAIETGDVMIHKPDRPLTLVNTTKPDITALENFRARWELLGQNATSTPDAIRGNTLPSGTPYSLGALQTQNAGSLFEIMTENKGLAIEDFMREFVILQLKKSLKNKDEIVGILDDAAIQEIDAMYIPQEAIKRHKQAIKDYLLNPDALNQPVPSPYNPAMMEQGVQQSLAQFGNKRFFKPDELDEKQWDELFSDFEWDNIRVEVTNENVDKQAVLTTLATVLQTIAANPMALQDPNIRMVLSQIMTETGKISPLQFTTPAQSVPQPQPSAQPASTGSDLTALAKTNG